MLHPHLARAAAGLAGRRLRALSRARSLALAALGQRGELDVGGGTEHGLLEIERELITQVGAAVDAGAVAPPAAEDVAEDLAEDVAESVPRIEALSCTTRSIDARVAKLVVGGALLRVGQDLVRLLDLLETALGLVVGGVAVRVEFHGEAPVGLLDLDLRRGARQVEHLVVVTSRHAYPSPFSIRKRRGPWDPRRFASLLHLYPSGYEVLRSLSWTSSNSASRTSSFPPPDGPPEGSPPSEGPEP